MPARCAGIAEGACTKGDGEGKWVFCGRRVDGYSSTCSGGGKRDDVCVSRRGEGASSCSTQCRGRCAVRVCVASLLAAAAGGGELAEEYTH